MKKNWHCSTDPPQKAEIVKSKLFANINRILVKNLC